MAVINNLNVLATAFKVNGINSTFLNVSGTYNTADILNGGELLENTLQYSFKVTGLLDHTIKSIVVKSVLLTSTGELCTTRNLSMGIDKYGSTFRGDFITSDSNKTIVSTEFVYTELQEENEKLIDLVVAMNSIDSCYYGLQGIVINLLDIDYAINISFGGSKTGRTISSITVAHLLVNQGSESVSFSKDPLSKYNNDIDNVEGRIYFRKDGIYVDNYQYGTVAPATETKAGIVKLRNAFDVFVNEETGESGILAPNEDGVAASSKLVFDTINTLKQYADDLVNGIPVPSIELDDGTIETIDEDYTFSNDFKKEADGKIYINWLEV